MCTSAKDKPPVFQLTYDYKSEKVKLVRAGNNLSQKQRVQLQTVLLENFEAFQWNPNNEIGRTNLVEHNIDTGEN